MIMNRNDLQKRISGILSSKRAASIHQVNDIMNVVDEFINVLVLNSPVRLSFDFNKDVRDVAVVQKITVAEDGKPHMEFVSFHCPVCDAPFKEEVNFATGLSNPGTDGKGNPATWVKCGTCTNMIDVVRDLLGDYIVSPLTNNKQ